MGRRGIDGLNSGYEGYERKKHTSRRNKLQIMRHRRVVNQSISNHLIGFVAAHEYA